jgi:hypothetical protein
MEALQRLLAALQMEGMHRLLQLQAALLAIGWRQARLRQ